MKTSILFLSLLFLNFQTLAQNVSTQSPETFFAYNLVCLNDSSFSRLLLEQPTYFQKEALGKRKNFKVILDSAAEDILNDIENKNFVSAAFTCAVIDELTLGFSLACFGSRDQKLDLRKSQEACQILINSYN